MQYMKLEATNFIQIPKVKGDFCEILIAGIGQGEQMNISYGTAGSGLANTGGSLTAGSLYYFEFPAYSHDQIEVTGMLVIRLGIRLSD